MRKTIITIVAAATAIATPAIAHASPINETQFNQTIEHDDLDLTTQRGIARLDERVRTEIRRACANGGRDSASVRLERECRATAFASAEREIRFAIAEANADRVRFAKNSAASDTDTPGA